MGCPLGSVVKSATKKQGLSWEICLVLLVVRCLLCVVGCALCCCGCCGCCALCCRGCVVCGRGCGCGCGCGCDCCGCWLLVVVVVVVLMTCVFPYVIAMHATNSGDRTPRSQTPGVPRHSRGLDNQQLLAIEGSPLGLNVGMDGVRKMP